MAVEPERRQLDISAENRWQTFRRLNKKRFTSAATDRIEIPTGRLDEDWLRQEYRSKETD
jgi:hypothetical protein